MEPLPNSRQMRLFQDEQALVDAGTQTPGSSSRPSAAEARDAWGHRAAAAGSKVYEHGTRRFPQLGEPRQHVRSIDAPNARHKNASCSRANSTSKYDGRKMMNLRDENGGYRPTPWARGNNPAAGVSERRPDRAGLERVESEVTHRAAGRPGRFPRTPRRSPAALCPRAASAHQSRRPGRALVRLGAVRLRSIGSVSRIPATKWYAIT